MTTPKFSEMSVAPPAYDEVRAAAARLRSDFSTAATPAGRARVIAEWDRLRRRIDTWSALTQLRFHQDTRNETFRRAREQCDELLPKLTELDVGLKRMLLESEHRAELEQAMGRQAFALWAADARAFSPAIEQDLVREAKLQAEYVELLASARLPFRDRAVTIPEIRRYTEDPGRETRHDAVRVLWRWFDENEAAIDRIFDDLVRLRSAMAAKLGLADFRELAYLRMYRIDYGPEEIAAFREQVEARVVPLCSELKRRQCRRLGLDELRYWDEPLHDPHGNPMPGGDHDWLLERAAEMFDGLGGGLDEFFRLMRSRELLDLQSREGKAGGGFCTTLHEFGVPFIYANFNGTKGDVEVFTHETGHAFQSWKSRDLPFDYLSPTTESCEIHSMSLEYLTWPFMELFFGADAERFRTIHLTEGLQFLPYGVAVDHFQHLVYARPEATPGERRAMWQEMERRYLPWRRYGDVEYLARGGLWQFQRHIYLMPFYYIDYTLALTCALQFWVRSERDREGAVRAYVELCARGGELPFRALVRTVGLVAPFDDGCLDSVVERACRYLEL